HPLKTNPQSRRLRLQKYCFFRSWQEKIQTFFKKIYKSLIANKKNLHQTAAKTQKQANLLHEQRKTSGTPY
ncbi:MAG: hypothetical protein IKZ55_11315, partial [Bacteroidales bacterium]|nr:hypothetical protein [Bacteroidales bacterium]